MTTPSTPKTLADEQIDQLVREHLGGMRPGAMLMYRNLIRAALAARPCPAARTLEYVIAWLEGGCDPKLAAKELRLLAAQPPADPLTPLTDLSEELGLHSVQPPAVAAIPEGWALKPLEPTKEMLESVGSILEPYAAKLVWMRMNLAVPQPPAGQQDGHHVPDSTKMVQGGQQDGGEVLSRHQVAVRLNDFPALSAFHSKHAMGSLAAPSCLCCGQSTQGLEIGVKHMELPSIVICKSCKDRATAGEATAAPHANMFHDAGAIAQCGYCKRYTLDRQALSDEQPTCTCGGKHGWSGSFLRPQSDSLWHGERPAVPSPAAPGNGEGGK